MTDTPSTSASERLYNMAEIAQIFGLKTVDDIAAFARAHQLRFVSVQGVRRRWMFWPQSEVDRALAATMQAAA
jgi:hypothetical protein